MTTRTLTFPTELLLAMSRLTNVESGHKLNVVVFKHDELIVCNGHVLVRVAWENTLDDRGKTVPGFEPFGIGRQHIEMAVAAQDRSLDENVSSERLSPEAMNYHRCRDPRDRSGRELTVVVEGVVASVGIVVGCGAALHVPRRDVRELPNFDLVTPTDAIGAPPNGIGIDGTYVAAINAVVTAGRWHHCGLQLKAWRSLLDPLLLTAGPVRAVIMPMRQPGHSDG